VRLAYNDVSGNQPATPGEERRYSECEAAHDSRGRSKGSRKESVSPRWERNLSLCSSIIYTFLSLTCCLCPRKLCKKGFYIGTKISDELPTSIFREVKIFTKLL
jgi:hypothetical protein